MDELPYHTAKPARQHRQTNSHVTFAASSACWLGAPSERETSQRLAAKINMHFSVADLLKWTTVDGGDHRVPCQDPPSAGAER